MSWTATITVQVKDNVLVAPWFYRADSLSESVRIMAEHDEIN